eukprot:gene27709-36469_t
MSSFYFSGISGRGVQHMQNFRPVFRLFMSTGSKIVVVHEPPQEKLDKLKIKTWPTWGCDISRFPWSYSETETCYILRGKATIIPKDGSTPVDITTGDLCTFPEGLSCIWDVKEPIQKHYYFN